MKEKFVKFFCCPNCRSDLDLFEFTKKNKSIKEGVFICDKCSSWYPIVSGIPRFVTNDFFNRNEFFLKHKDFLNKFKNIPKVHPERHKDTISSFNEQWIKYDKYGYSFRKKDFSRKLGLKIGDLKGKYVLDVGCGNGRFSRTAIDFGAKEVFSIDLISSIEKTSNKLKDCNVTCVQADILNLPFKENIFDFIFSIGVLHHTQNTKKAFQGLSKFLKKDGMISCTFYKKMHFIREFTDDLIRFFTTRLNRRVLWYLSYIPAFFGKIFNFIPVYSRKGRIVCLDDIINGSIVHINKDHVVCFDWWSPKNASRHSWKEVLTWHKEVGLSILKKNDYGAVSYLAKK